MQTCHTEDVKRFKLLGWPMKYKLLLQQSHLGWVLTNMMWGLSYTTQCQRVWKVMYRSVVVLEETKTRPNVFCIMTITIGREMTTSLFQTVKAQKSERKRTYVLFILSWSIAKTLWCAAARCNYHFWENTSRRKTATKCVIIVKTITESWKKMLQKNPKRSLSLWGKLCITRATSL